MSSKFKQSLRRHMELHPVHPCVVKSWVNESLIPYVRPLDMTGYIPAFTLVDTGIVVKVDVFGTDSSIHTAQ